MAGLIEGGLKRQGGTFTIVKSGYTHIEWFKFYLFGFLSAMFCVLRNSEYFFIIKK